MCPEADFYYKYIKIAEYILTNIVQGIKVYCIYIFSIIIIQFMLMSNFFLFCRVYKSINMLLNFCSSYEENTKLLVLLNTICCCILTEMKFHIIFYKQTLRIFKIIRFFLMLGYVLSGLIPQFAQHHVLCLFLINIETCLLWPPYYLWTNDMHIIRTYSISFHC